MTCRYYVFLIRSFPHPCILCFDSIHGRDSVCALQNLKDCSCLLLLFRDCRSVVSLLSPVLYVDPGLVVTEKKKVRNVKHSEWKLQTYLFIGSDSWFLLEQILHLRMVNQTESWENLPSGGRSPDSNHGLGKRLQDCVTRETATVLHFHWERE